MQQTRKPVQKVLSFLTVIIVLYGASVLGLFFFQSHLLYSPSRQVGVTPNVVGLEYEPVKIVTDDGVLLDGWFVPAKNPRGVLLFFHGNAGNISHRVDSLKIFNKLGLSTLIFDYRGYGLSEGAISEEGSYRDAEAAWRFLTERKFSTEKIVIFGRSLGAAIAAHLASRHTPGALIIEAGFVSIPELGGKLYPWLPVRWLVRFAYDTAAYLSKVSCPVLIVHSPDDEIIPFTQGRKLFENAIQPKRFLQIRGGHNDGFLVSGRDYIDGLDDFLSASLGK
jgi:fermentation-respiration switch protein FrsA (DUF1100 family)